MSELISGKEALIALANGEEVEVKHPNDKRYYEWAAINPEASKMFLSAFLVDGHMFQFRLKPKTITINGIEVPAPFKPKDGDRFYYMSDERNDGYSSWNDLSYNYMAVWRTEEEIKQVVAALRSIFKGV